MLSSVMAGKFYENATHQRKNTVNLSTMLCTLFNVLVSPFLLRSSVCNFYFIYNNNFTLKKPILVVHVTLISFFAHFGTQFSYFFSYILLKYILFFFFFQ